MARPKKDGVFLNVFMDRKVLKELNEYCEKTGATKTKAVEIAVTQFLNDQKKTFNIDSLNK